MVIERIDLEKCTGCGVCAMVCPMDVIRIDEKSVKARIAYQADCMTCFNCEDECPAKAIHVSPKRAREAPLPW
jgi:NAD-dependent dihydropyrimidine dehydrogenase PreA subunit